jgi:8-oxo-dGTP pyrophosphatase MutT (NUDIX family)
MPISPYLHQLRTQIGHALLFVPSVTIITFDAHERVLLVRHRDRGQWVAPGGSVDPLEQPADAAVREMWEETGLLIEPMRILGIYGGPAFHWFYANGDEIAYQQTVFLARVVGGQLKHDDEELFELAYYTAEQARALATPDWMPIVLADAFHRRETAYFQPPTWRPPEEAKR